MPPDSLDIEVVDFPRKATLHSEISPAITLGSGYDTGTKSVRNLVAEGNVRSEPVASNKAEYFIDWCEDYSELSSFFRLSASASYSGTGTGLSASGTMMRATNIESSRIYIAVWVRMIAKREFFASARLRKDALTVLNSEKLSSFSEKFGGSWTKTLFHGGELAAVMEISASETETMEELRVSMSAKGWGAKGAAEMEQALRELTQTRRVVIRYCQSGGSVGNATSGIIVTDAESLILRMQQFVTEVWGTNGLDGKAIPMEAELENSRRLTNWPDNQTGDPDRPYPREIEPIAQSVLLLKDKLVLVQDVLRPTQGTPPGSVEAARELLPYIQFVVNYSGSAIEDMVRGERAQYRLSIESFYQYRIRNLLNVSPGNHSNAGPLSELGQGDSKQFIERVFGRNLPNPFVKWPQLRIDEWWGYQGQEPGAFGGVHVICPQHGGSVAATAHSLAGNPGPDDGVVVHVGVHPSAYAGGGACGYHPIHMLAVRTILPNISILDPLPLTPSDIVGKDLISTAKVELKQVDKNVWNAFFVVTLPDIGSCGRYTLTVKESLGSHPEIERLRKFESYWIDVEKAKLELHQSFESEKGWMPVDFEIIVDKALRLQAQHVYAAERPR